LTAVLMCAVYLAVMPVYTSQVAAMPLGDGSAPGQQAIDQMLATLPILSALILLSVLVNALIFSGLMKLMIRGEAPKLPFFFAAGADELRLLGSWGLMFLGMIGLGLCVGAAFWLSQFLASLGPGPGGIIGLVAACAVIIVGIWLATRLSLVAPAVIAQRRLGIEPSWSITEENAWRLIGFWLLFIVAFFIISSLLTPFLSPPGYLAATQDIYAAARSPTRMQAAMHHAYELQAAGYALSNGGNIVRMVVGALLGVGATVLLAIAGGAAWQKLTEDDETKFD
jgi:hypothetical protein